MIMRLFSEKILHQTELGKLKQLCERSESTLETNRKKTAQFHKEVSFWRWKWKLSLSVQHTKDTFPETKMWNVDKWASNISQFENHIRRDLPIKTISGWGSSESDQPIVSWTRSEKRPICRPNQNQKIGWNTSLSSHCMFSVYFKLILIEKDGSKIWIFCLYQNSVLVDVQFEYEQF